MEIAADRRLGPDTGVSGGDEARTLLTRHASGDTRAFAELVELFRAPVYGYLVRCAIDRASRDDVFQDAFLKVHAAAKSFAGEHVRPWVFAIVANTVRSHFRKQRVRSVVALGKDDALDDAADPAPDGEALSVAKETADFVEAAIAMLPLPQREVLVLACVEKMTMEDCASSLGIPENTVKTLLRRARITLASQLAKREARGNWEISR